MTVTRPRSSGLASTAPKSVLPPVSEDKYRDVIMRLKKLLDAERLQLQQARSNLAAELHSRTELEIFLRQCVEDVRQDIARKRSEVLAGEPAVGGSPDHGVREGRVGSPTLASFSAADRERVLELLLAQERVVNLVYSKTFPHTL
jgi:hypothetical protein